MGARVSSATVVEGDPHIRDEMSKAGSEGQDLNVDEDIHLWAVKLVGSPELEDNLVRLLSLDEKRRACRFCQASLRRNFTLSHGILRVLLGQYLHLEPVEVDFRYGSTGKPSLSAQTSRLQFSMTHSDQFVVYAFANDCELGVDIERVTAFPDMDAVAAEFFCPEEYSELVDVDPTQRNAAFFNCWTRKEAYVKALGGGLSIPFDGFRVSLRPGYPAVLARSYEHSHEQSWHMHHLTPAPGYVGALVFAGGDREFRTRCFGSADELIHEIH
jgi:4'-phosphopantetheinyl transferase